METVNPFFPLLHYPWQVVCTTNSARQFNYCCLKQEELLWHTVMMMSFLLLFCFSRFEHTYIGMMPDMCVPNEEKKREKVQRPVYLFPHKSICCTCHLSTTLLLPLSLFFFSLVGVSMYSSLTVSLTHIWWTRDFPDICEETIMYRTS